MADAYDLNGDQWRNRIVGYDEVAPDQLLAHPQNPKIHPKHQQDALSGALSEIGWIDTPVVNVTTGYMIDGHARVKLALRNGEETVPVIMVELTEEEEKLALATLDPIGQLFAMDAEILDDLLHDVQTGDEAIQQMLAEMAEREGLTFGENGQEGADAEPEIDRAEELREKWGVESGQLWALGEHRLICGDCTDADVVERVMGGDEADFCFTDPPYNVGKKYTDDTDDSRSRADFERWCQSWLRFTPRPLFLTVGVKRLLWWGAITGEPDWTIAWVKKNGQSVTGLGGTNKWDPILCYGVQPDSGVDIVEINNDYSENIKASGGHPTAKPPELWRYVIERFGGKVIYEPFSGSGTTIIAAENLSRQARAIEISPAYCAVALDRYERAFGVTPELIEDF